jgi:hypothetical protein
MGMISITDGVTIFQGQADEVASPVWNANTNITIGGVARTQVDTQRLNITVKIACKQSEARALMDVVKSFTKNIYYTPSRILYDKTDIDEMEVVIDGSPKISIEGRDGELLYWVELMLFEVIK